MNDIELIEFAGDFRDGILEGRLDTDMYWLVAAPLADLLDYFGVRVRLVEGWVGGLHHHWIELRDGRILDPTGDQFGLDAIYLGPRPIEYRTADEERP